MKSQIEQMRILFRIYNNQCNNRPIDYTIYDDGVSWLVMGGIELSYMLYQGEHQPIFMCLRYCEGFGDDVYYFKSFNECEKVWLMREEDLINYINSITIN